MQCAEGRFNMVNLPHIAAVIDMGTMSFQMHFATILSILDVVIWFFFNPGATPTFAALLPFNVIGLTIVDYLMIKLNWEVAVNKLSRA